MKFAASLFCCALACAEVFAQSEPSLMDRIFKLGNKENLNISLNMHGSYDAPFGYESESMDESAFKMQQLRLDIKGKINDRLSYRWRQRLNRPNNGAGSIDNVSSSIDYAMIRLQMSKRWAIALGRQCALTGGVEYDKNPIDVIEFSDMTNYITAFMTGVHLSYQLSPNHLLNFQVLDGRNGTFEDKYGLNLEKSKLPMNVLLNWNGAFFDGLYTTNWAVSFTSQAKGEGMSYVALGNKLKFSDKLDMYIDLMRSYEELDDKGIMTDLLGRQNGHNLRNVLYQSAVARVNFRFLPRWNFFLKGMFETAEVAKADGLIEKGKYRTSYGYLGGLEYYPLPESNLRFYAAFVGRSYRFTQRAMMRGASDYDTQRVQAGFIYQLPVF